MSTRKFNIRSILRDHLLAIDELPEINWENMYYEPVKDTPYIRETLMPSDEPLTANNERTSVGLYQLDVFVPSGSSIKTAEELADTIKEHFRPAQVIDGLKLERSVVLQGNDQPPWYMIPIRIDYRAHQQNTGG